MARNKLTKKKLKKKNQIDLSNVDSLTFLKYWDLKTLPFGKNTWEIEK